MTCQAYLEKFQNIKDVIKHHDCTGGIVGSIEMALEVQGIDQEFITQDEREAATEVTEQVYWATGPFILAVD